MGKVLLTLHHRDAEPDLAAVMGELGLKAGEVDQEYGVQMIDPVAGDYVILVEEAAAKRIDPDYEEVSGPYSNPRIEPFGPPEE